MFNQSFSYGGPDGAAAKTSCFFDTASKLTTKIQKLVVTITFDILSRKPAATAAITTGTMTRIVAITILAIVAIISGATTAFVLPFSTQDQQRLLAKATDETDFDAPVLKNPVMKTDAPTVLDHEIMVVDDECYLGKYGQYDECVDFGKYFSRLSH